MLPITFHNGTMQWQEKEPQTVTFLHYLKNNEPYRTPCPRVGCTPVGTI